MCCHVCWLTCVLTCVLPYVLPCVLACELACELAYVLECPDCMLQVLEYPRDLSEGGAVLD